MPLKLGLVILAISCPFALQGGTSLGVSFTSISPQVDEEIYLDSPFYVAPSAHRLYSRLPVFQRNALLWELDAPFASRYCGFLWRAGLGFTTQDQGINMGLILRGLPFLRCDLTSDAVIFSFGLGRALAVQSHWVGWRGPGLEIYGDPFKLMIFGWSLRYELGSLQIHELVAFDPEQVQEFSQIPFYPGEREYWGLRYVADSLTLTSEFWLGEGEIPFNFKRTRLSLAVPIFEGFEVVVEGEWEFSKEDPFDLLNISWKVEF